MSEIPNLIIDSEYTQWGVKIHYSGITLNDDNYFHFLEVTGSYNNTLNRNLLLVDAREVKREVSLSKLYEAVTLYGAAPGIGCIGKRLAILSSKQTDDAGSSFLDDVCANRGLWIHFFFDEEKALAWLLK